MKKYLLAVICCLIIGLFMPNKADATQVFAENTGITSPLKMKLAAKYDAPTNDLKLSLENIILLKDMKYTVRYTADDMPQEIYGEIKPFTNNSIERNLRLGDCSNRNCNYNVEASNIKIEVLANYYFLGSESINTSL